MSGKQTRRQNPMAAVGRWWPRRCAACLAWTDTELCADCSLAFHRATPRCPRCGLPMAGADACCLPCLRHPPVVSGTVVAVHYACPWDHLLRSMKFHQDTALVALFADGLARRIMAPDSGAIAQAVSLVIPVPLHRRRLRERGFNQSWEMARRLGRRLGLPARADTLLRWRETGSQAQLARADRVANVAGAFMPDPQGGSHLRGRDIALVDDVMTTGATAHAAALAALEAGARSVSLWVAARTPADAGSA